MWAKNQGCVKVTLIGSYNLPSPALNTAFLLNQGFRWYNDSYCTGKVRKLAQDLQFDYKILVPALKESRLGKHREPFLQEAAFSQRDWSYGSRCAGWVKWGGCAREESQDSDVSPFPCTLNLPPLESEGKSYKVQET